jgi:hypothetical protein
MNIKQKLQDLAAEYVNSQHGKGLGTKQERRETKIDFEAGSLAGIQFAIDEIKGLANITGDAFVFSENIVYGMESCAEHLELLLTKLKDVGGE